MKKIFVMLMLITSSLALACPDFNGTFNKCTTGDRTLDDLSGIKKATLEVTQNGVDVTAKFMGAETKFKIGETVQSSYYDDQLKAQVDSTITAACNNNVLELQEESKITYRRGRVEYSSTDSDIYFTEGTNKIVMDMTTSQGNQRNNMTITCKRK